MGHKRIARHTVSAEPRTPARIARRDLAPSARLFLVIYFLSGAAALLYQVAWSRLLALHMGHTVAAVGTVLAAFMGGLAAGAAVAGRIAQKLSERAALQTYAYVEVAIGVLAVLVPWGLAGMRPLLQWTYADGAGAAFALARLASCLTVIAVPAALMGATLPLAVRWFARAAIRPGADAARLYTANTIGAAFGAALAGFVLLPFVGLRWTTFVGVALNLVAAVGAFGIARRGPAPPLQKSPPRRDRTDGAKAATDHPIRAEPALAAGVLFISGAIALTHEVAWTRILALIVGPTVYAFSAMLVAFITGLGIGSALGTRMAARSRRPGFWLGMSLMCAACGALLASVAVESATLGIARAVSAPGATFASSVLIQAGIVAAMLLPMTTAMGIGFPLGIALATRGAGRVASDVARVYALNTIGAIAGALIASFVLIGSIGVQRTILGAAMLGVVTGLTVIVRTSTSRAPTLVGLAAAIAVAAMAFASPKWDRGLISSGGYKYAPYMADTELVSGLEAGALLFYDEGPAGTVAVRRATGALSLSIDGKVDASNAGDMLTQKLLAHLPLLLHPHPRRVCIIGLGSGVTLGAALKHPIDAADTLEISPAVVAASDFFKPENHGALADPRSRLIVGDGRSHLLLSSGTYDVIISEPSNPWMAGVASLFTREFFVAAKQRLAPGGLFCQWAHTYDISGEDLRSIAATFGAVFPEGTLWLVGEGDVLFVGGDSDVTRLLPGVTQAWNRPGVSQDLAEVLAREPFSLVSLLVADARGLASYADGTPLQTDDRTGLEFSTPRRIYGRSDQSNAAELLRLDRPGVVQRAIAEASAAQWRNRGLMLARAGTHGLAYDDLARAVQIDADDAEALEGLTRAAAGARRSGDAVALLTGVAERNPRAVAVRVQLAGLQAAAGDREAAMHTIQGALDIDASNPLAQEQLASIFADAGDAERLADVVRVLTAQHPDSVGTLYYTATLHYLHEDFAQAAAVAERLTARDPSHARALNLLGAAYASLGQNERARKAFEASIRANPQDATARLNVGAFEMRSGNPAAASAHFGEALLLDPGSVQTMDALATALEQMGNMDRAARLREAINTRNRDGR